MTVKPAALGATLAMLIAIALGGVASQVLLRSAAPAAAPAAEPA
jgi:hypothetical protein